MVIVSSKEKGYVTSFDSTAQCEPTVWSHWDYHDVNSKFDAHPHKRKSLTR